MQYVSILFWLHLESSLSWHKENMGKLSEPWKNMSSKASITRTSRISRSCFSIFSLSFSWLACSPPACASGVSLRVHKKYVLRANIWNSGSRRIISLWTSLLESPKNLSTLSKPSFRGIVLFYCHIIRQKTTNTWSLLRQDWGVQLRIPIWQVFHYTDHQPKVVTKKSSSVGGWASSCLWPPWALNGHMIFIDFQFNSEYLHPKWRKS